MNNWLLVMLALTCLSGCAVVSVAGTVVSTTVGVAVDVVGAGTPDIVD